MTHRGHKTTVNRLAEIQATQRAIAGTLGISKGTVHSDIAQSWANSKNEDEQNQMVTSAVAQNRATVPAGGRPADEKRHMIAEQKIRTQRILGRLIREGQEKGEIARQSENQSNLVNDGNKVKKTLPELGITRKQSFTFKTIEAVPSERTGEKVSQAMTHIKHFQTLAATRGGAMDTICSLCKSVIRLPGLNPEKVYTCSRCVNFLMLATTESKVRFRDRLRVEEKPVEARSVEEFIDPDEEAALSRRPVPVPTRARRRRGFMVCESCLKVKYRGEPGGAYCRRCLEALERRKNGHPATLIPATKKLSVGIRGKGIEIHSSISPRFTRTSLKVVKQSEVMEYGFKKA